MADRIDKTYSTTCITVVRSEGPTGALADGSPAFRVSMTQPSGAPLNAKDLRAMTQALEAALTGV